MGKMIRIRHVCLPLMLAAALMPLQHTVAQELPVDLIPLQVGNTWNYSQSELDKSGKLLRRKGVQAKVADEKKIGNKHWYKYQEFGDNFWVRNDTGGQYEAILDDEETSPNKNTKEILFYRYPAKATPTKYKLEFGEMTLVSKSTTVETKAGKFACYHYRLVESELKIDMFMSPGKGLVKNRIEDDTSIKITELISMRLRDKPVDLIPLQVGNTWNYSQSELDKSGKLLGRKGVQAKVADEKKIGNKHWYKYQEFGDNFWVRNDTGGQYEAILDDEETSPNKNTKEILFYRYPAKATPTKYKLEFGEMTLVSKSTTVETKAGKFACYHYRLVESELKIDMFMSPGKGLVKNRFEDDRSIKITELISMQLSDK